MVKVPRAVALSLEARLHEGWAGVVRLETDCNQYLRAFRKINF